MPDPTPPNPPKPALEASAQPQQAQPAARGLRITRRNFLWAGWAALATFLSSGAAAAARFLFPNVTYEPSARFNAGKPEEYSLGVSTKWLESHRTYLVRTSKGFYALWARCTHLGCTPNWFSDENRFKCPCHGSNFDIKGDVIAGPAPIPLWRCEIALSETGEMMINKSILNDTPGPRGKVPYFLEVPYTV